VKKLSMGSYRHSRRHPHITVYSCSPSPCENTGGVPAIWPPPTRPRQASKVGNLFTVTHHTPKRSTSRTTAPQNAHAHRPPRPSLRRLCRPPPPARRRPPRPPPVYHRAAQTRRCAVCHRQLPRARRWASMLPPTRRRSPPPNTTPQPQRAAPRRCGTAAARRPPAAARLYASAATHHPTHPQRSPLPLPSATCRRPPLRLFDRRAGAVA